MHALYVGDEVPTAFRGRAYAVLERACYVRTEEPGQLVLLAEDLPPAPHGITLSLGDGDFRDVIPRDAALTLDGGVLRLQKPSTARQAWVIDGVTRYHSRLDVVPRASSASVARALGVVATALGEHETALRGADRLTNSSRRRVRSAVRRLSIAVAAGDEERAATIATGLVGFGPGLTPSGDDALIGFLAAQRALGTTSEAVRRTVLGSAGHTCDISWGYLEAAAHGHFCELVIELATAVCEGSDERALTAAEECLDLGATSGADGVLGMLGGFEAERCLGPAHDLGA
jgi:hypothetical protein